MNLTELIEKAVEDPIERDLMNENYSAYLDTHKIVLNLYKPILNVPVDQMTHDQLKVVIDSPLFQEINELVIRFSRLKTFKISSFTSPSWGRKFQMEQKQSKALFSKYYVSIKGDVFDAHSTYLTGTKGLLSVNRKWFNSLYNLGARINGLKCVDSTLFPDLYDLHNNLYGFMRKLVKNQDVLEKEAKSREDWYICKVYNEYSTELCNDFMRISNIVADKIKGPPIEETSQQSAGIRQDIMFLFDTRPVPTETIAPEYLDLPIIYI